MSQSTPGRLPKLFSALIALVCVASLSATASAAPLAESGMNGWNVEQLPAPQRDLQLAAMQANGVQVVRSDAPWANIQPLPPTPTGPGYQFGATDAWVTALANHHLTWEPLIDFSVWGAKTCPGFCAPTSDSTYAAFAQAVAVRYGPGGTFWAQNPRSRTTRRRSSRSGMRRTSRPIGSHRPLRHALRRGPERDPRRGAVGQRDRRRLGR